MSKSLLVVLTLLLAAQHNPKNAASINDLGDGAACGTSVAAGPVPSDDLGDAS